MPLYQYKALSPKGKTFSSTIDADSLFEAKQKLIRLQVAAFQIEQLNDKKRGHTLSKNEVLNLTREIARLLHAGLPLYETLSALVEKYQDQKAHKILLDIADQVKNGTPFSKALSRHPENFDLLYSSMIANAEKTGRLSLALHEVADLISRQLQVRKQLMSALLYPTMLFGFCLVVLSSLLFYVIPSLKELFDGHDLHPFTKLVFAASGFACSMQTPIACLFIAIAASLVAIPFSPRWKKQLFSLSFHLPYFKTLLAKVAFVRFSRAVATLLEGGLPLVQAFKEARLVTHHSALESIIQKAEERITQGESVSKPFQDVPLIPPLIPRMLGIAEEGGKLPFMMRQIAEIYEDELERTLRTFSTVAQPILLLVLGLIIGFVLLSVLLPLTDVSSFATD